MTTLFRLVTLVFTFISAQTFAQRTDALRQKIQQIVSTKNAIVGVSIIGNDGKDNISFFMVRNITQCKVCSNFILH